MKNGSKFSNAFQLWSPDFNGGIVFEKIQLDPKRCNGHAFRFATQGWGLIQLYFGGLNKMTSVFRTSGILIKRGIGIGGDQ